MTKLVKSIMVNAPAAKIFDYMNNPNNLPEFWPSIVDVKDIERLPNGGTRFKLTYKMGGIKLDLVSEDIEVVPNQRVVTRTSGGIESQVTFTYEENGTATKVTAEDEYKVPIPVIGKLAEAVIIKMNEQEAVTVLANLKLRMEAA